MKRSYLNILIDALSLIAFATMISTGLVLKFILPPGSGRVERVMESGGWGRSIDLSALAEHQGLAQYRVSSNSTEFAVDECEKGLCSGDSAKRQALESKSADKPPALDSQSESAGGKNNRKGYYGFAYGASYFGLSRHEWGVIHFYISLAFLILLVVHLILHWNWIKAISFGTPAAPQPLKRKIIFIFIIVFIFAAILFPWMGKPQTISKQEFIQIHNESPE